MEPKESPDDNRWAEQSKLAHSLVAEPSVEYIQFVLHLVHNMPSGSEIVYEEGKDEPKISQLMQGATTHTWMYYINIDMQHRTPLSDWKLDSEVDEGVLHVRYFKPKRTGTFTSTRKVYWFNCLPIDDPCLGLVILHVEESPLPNAPAMTKESALAKIFEEQKGVSEQELTDNYKWEKEMMDKYDWTGLTRTFPRAYQRELFYQQMQVVAILVMAYQLNKFPGKKVFFLTSTAALASQQDAVFAHEVGKYETGAIYGDRSESFKRNTCRDCPVIFATVASLANLVNEGIVALDSASLVIFDEAHHIQKDHPFNVFLRDFLLPMEQESRPMIMGLSASPAAKKSEAETTDALCTLMANSTCRIMKPQRFAAILKKYVNFPKIEYLEASYNNQEQEMFELISSHLLSVNELLARYPAGIDELLLQAIKRGDVGSEEYEKSLNIAVTRSEFDLAAFKPALMYTWGIVKGTRLLNSVGAYEAKEYLIQRIRKLQKECIEFPNSELLMELLKTAAEAQRGLDNIAVDDSQPCPTLRELLKVLKGHVNKEGFRGIIFVERRKVANAICRQLKRHKEAVDVAVQFKPTPLVGHGAKKKQAPTNNNCNNSSSSSSDQPPIDEMMILGDGADIRMKANEQLNVTELFRKGDCHLLIATAVAEEGLDIKECNVVIRYDAIKSVTGLIQSRGRARHHESEFYIMCRNMNTRPAVEELIRREQVMECIVDKLMNNPNAVYSIISEAEQDRNPKSKLGEWCQKRTKNTPTYCQFPNNNVDAPGFVATCNLPPNTAQTVPDLEQFSFTGSPRSKKSDAEASAADAAIKYITLRGLWLPSAPASPGLPSAPASPGSPTQQSAWLQPKRCRSESYDTDDAKSILNEFFQKNLSNLQTPEYKSSQLHAGGFSCELKMPSHRAIEHNVVVGNGPNKAAAEKAAAIQACLQLQRLKLLNGKFATQEQENGRASSSPTPTPANPRTPGSPIPYSVSSSSTPVSPPASPVGSISFLYELQQQGKGKVQFEESEVAGQAHQRRFTITCTFTRANGEPVVGQGVGSTKQLAKNQAADAVAAVLRV